jgi:predicted enzyme related to lactoylglutathione lyase
MTYAPHNCLIWAEIPVSDLNAAITFYGEVTGMDLILNTDMGPAPIAIFKYEEPGISLHLFEGKSAPDGLGNRVHLNSQGKLEDTMERVKAAGGQVLSPAIELPDGRFFYAADPDGNSVGFFEPK